jgi:hydrogenase maturation factor
VSSDAIPTAATDAPPDACDPRGVCITCADEGVVMRVVGVEEDGLGACAGPGGGREVVDLALVAPVGPGDAVLVHAGVALVRLDGEGAG